RRERSSPRHRSPPSVRLWGRLGTAPASPIGSRATQPITRMVRSRPSNGSPTRFREYSVRKPAQKYASGHTALGTLATCAAHERTVIESLMIWSYEAWQAPSRLRRRGSANSESGPAKAVGRSDSEHPAHFADRVAHALLVKRSVDQRQDLV